MIKAIAMAMTMAKVLVKEMQLGMAGAAIQGGVELGNEGVKKAAKEAVVAERKDSGCP